MKKILIFNPDQSIQPEALKIPLVSDTGNTLMVCDVESFNEAISTNKWSIVLVNFKTKYFWNLPTLKLAKFIDGIKKNQLQPDFLLGNSTRRITISDIHSIVCTYYSVCPEKVRNRSSKKEIAQARHICIYLAKKFTTSSFKVIGKWFDGRDHTTAMHSNQTVKDLMDTEEMISEDISNLTNLINSQLKVA